MIDVTDFGAIGDGTTDDTAAIQDAVNAGAGDVVCFPPGVYMVSGATATGAISLPNSNVRLQGAGKHLVTIKMAAANDSAAFVGIDLDKIEIDGIGFDGAATSRLAWQRALVLRGCEDVSITNCRFYRIGDGGVLFGKQGFGGSDAYGEGTRQPKRVRVSGNEWLDCWGTVCLLSKYVGIEDLEITNNSFRNSGTIAISVESEGAASGEIAKRSIITGNRVIGTSYLHSSGFSNVSWGIWCGELAQDCVIANNIVDGVLGNTVSGGIVVSTSPAQSDTSAKQSIVSANTIRGVTAVSGRGHGILLQAGDTSATDIAVHGNAISDCRDGISIECDAGSKTLGYVRGAAITGNNIVGATEFGIFHMTVGGSGTLPLIDSVISNNVIRNSGSHGITGFFKESVISGNKISGSGGAGLSTLAGSTKLVINGNNLTGNTGGGMSGSPTSSVITDNITA